MAVIYDGPTDTFRLWWAGVEYTFTDGVTAMTVDAKLKFVSEMQAMITALAAVTDDLDNMAAIYIDRSYHTGDNAITDADVAALGLTAADVGALVGLFAALIAFVGGEAVTTADYGKTINLYRTDV